MNIQVIELFKAAMLHEDDGEKYYTQQSKQWHEQSVCDNFKYLAEEERKHGQWLRQYFDEVKEHGDSSILNQIKDIESPRLFDWSDIRKISDMDLKEVFEKAMAMEKSSFEYYESLKKETEDPKLLGLLEILVDWEKSHYKTFEEALNQL